MEELSKKQLEVVKWLIENGRESEPYAAVAHGLVSSAGMTKWGGRDAVRKMVVQYKKSLPPPPLTEEEVTLRLKKMVPAALKTIEDVMVQGTGDRTAVSTAQWLLREAYRAPVQSRATPMDAEEFELAKVLKLVK